MPPTKRSTSPLPARPAVPLGFTDLEGWCAVKNVRPTCVYRWIKAGKITAIYVPGHGRRYFIRQADADRCLKPITIGRTNVRNLL